MTLRDTIEEAFEAAATFATQPLPAGPRTAVVTTAGGWGVVTADAISRDGALELAALPDDLRAAIDEHLPPRWSRNNPIDLAGGETRDTIPSRARAGRPASRHRRDRLPRPRHPVEPGPHGARRRLLSRTTGSSGSSRTTSARTHASPQAAADISDATGKPILTATELAIASPDNPGPATVRATGRLCYASANRAVTALGHLWRYARFRRARGYD